MPTLVPHWLLAIIYNQALSFLMLSPATLFMMAKSLVNPCCFWNRSSTECNICCWRAKSHKWKLSCHTDSKDLACPSEVFKKLFFSLSRAQNTLEFMLKDWNFAALFEMKKLLWWAAAVIYGDHSLFVWDVRSFSKVLLPFLLLYGMLCHWLMSCH